MKQEAIEYLKCELEYRKNQIQTSLGMHFDLLQDKKAQLDIAESNYLKDLEEQTKRYEELKQIDSIIEQLKTLTD